MKQLKEAIKNNTFKSVYLFTGEEDYLIQLYVKRIREKVFEGQDAMMNLDQYTVDQKDFEPIIGSLETLPFFAEKRLVILWNMDLFNAKNKEKSNQLTEKLDQLGDTTICIIIEEKIDKRSKLYKKINAIGAVYEFKHLDEKALISYIGRRLSGGNLKISTADAKFLVDMVGYELNILEQELSKIIDYCHGQDIVSKSNIEQIATKHIEAKIFELVDAIGTKKREKALQLYQDMIYLKEPTTRILFMISRQMMLIYQIKLMLFAKKGQQQMASELKIPPFVVNKLIGQSKQFDMKTLRQILAKLLDLEYQFKQGKMDLTMGIEVFILEQNKKATE